MDEIREHSRRLVEALKTRQAKNPVVSGIGDILLEAALDWGKEYYEYLTGFPMAHALFAEEEGKNPRFKEHVMTTDFDLDLLNEARRHVVSSKIVNKSSTATAIDAWSEGFWILFDHYLVMSKMARGESTAQKYVIPRRGTIPLELLQIRPSSFTDPPIARSRGFHIGTQRSTSDGQPGAYSGSNASQDSLLYPIHLNRIGREEGTFTFYVESDSLRKSWSKKLQEAVDLHAQAQKASQVVSLETLSDQTFGGTSTIGSLVPSAPAESQFGNPTCSAPLTTADGQNLVVAGCAQGLFIGFRGKPRTMRQVVHLAGITQCAILPEFGFILVVAQKVLIAYSLEALVPSGGRTDQASKTPQRLSGSKDVLFMRVGKVGDVDPRTLVIYVKKSGVKESVFKALEPVSTTDRTKAAGKHGFLGMGASKNPEWFRTYKVYSFRFLRSKLAIVCAKGVEIMNLESLRTMSVPDFSHQRDEYSQKLAKRCDDHRTLGMFRLQDNLFLLVYNAFCFHVDKHGEPLLRPVGVIEWESRPEQVAFQSPFIYAVSSKMIEIRNAFTGRLAQVITGREITLTYDGDGIESGAGDIRRNPTLRDEDNPDRRLHVSMKHPKLLMSITGPNELSFCSVDAIQTVLGAEGRLNRGSWYIFISRSVHEHIRLRKVWDNALVDSYHEVLQKRVGELILGLLDTTILEPQKPVLLSDWLSWAGIDLAGSLGFNESFRLVSEKGDSAGISKMIRDTIRFANCIGQIPWTKPILARLPYPRPIQKYTRLAKQTLEARIPKPGDVVHFLVSIDKQLGEDTGKPTMRGKDQLVTHQFLLMLGGDAIATTLNTALFFLLSYPPYYERLYSELVALQDVDAVEARLLQLSTLPFLRAVIMVCLIC
ncbi:RHO1 GDP-GTP exchange protein 1/2, partial [Phenoliferia sp. Uapishka_3]